MVLQSKYLRVDPENFQVGSVAGSTIDFRFKVGYTEHAVLPASFFTFVDSLRVNPGGGFAQKAVLDALQANTVNNTPVLTAAAARYSTGSRCFNHAAFLIDSFEIRINNTTVERLDSEFGLIDTYVKRTNSSNKNESLYSVMNLKESYLQRDKDASDAIEHEWVFKPDAAALWRHNIRQNSEVHIRVKFVNNLLKIVQTIPQFVANVGPNPQNVRQATSVAYEYLIKNFILYVRLDDTGVEAPVGKIDGDMPQVTYVLDSYLADVRKIPDAATSSTTTHTVASTTKEIGFAFQSSLVGGPNPFFSPSVFISGPLYWLSSTQNFTYYADNVIKASIKFQNINYPYNPYENNAFDKGCYHFYLSQMDKLHNNQMLKLEHNTKNDQSGSGLDYSKLGKLEIMKYNKKLGIEKYDYFRKLGRIWSYDIIKKPEDRDTRLQIDLSMPTPMPTTNLLVFNRYERICMVYYNNLGEVHKVDVADEETA